MVSDSKSANDLPSEGITLIEGPYGMVAQPEQSAAAKIPSTTA
jgi:hypothetical protein